VLLKRSWDSMHIRLSVGSKPNSRYKQTATSGLFMFDAVEDSKMTLDLLLLGEYA